MPRAMPSAIQCHWYKVLHNSLTLALTGNITETIKNFQSYIDWSSSPLAASDSANNG
jgi:hypothetical protein